MLKRRNYHRSRMRPGAQGGAGGVTCSSSVSKKICHLFLLKAGSPSFHSVGNKPELFIYDIKWLPRIDKANQEENSNQSISAGRWRGAAQTSQNHLSGMRKRPLLLKDKREKCAVLPAGLRSGQSKGTATLRRRCRCNHRYSGPRNKVTCFFPLRTSSEWRKNGQCSLESTIPTAKCRNGEIFLLRKKGLFRSWKGSFSSREGAVVTMCVLPMRHLLLKAKKIKLIIEMLVLLYSEKECLL